MKELYHQKFFICIQCFMCFFFYTFRLQLLLLSDIERVRAASLRALRYSIHRSTIFDKLLEYRLDYLVCR